MMLKRIASSIRSLSSICELLISVRGENALSSTGVAQYRPCFCCLFRNACHAMVNTHKWWFQKPFDRQTVCIQLGYALCGSALYRTGSYADQPVCSKDVFDV